MKTIVISDLHLDHRFHEDKYQFLKQLIGSSDRVIINGDLFSDYAVTFEDFYYSPWSQLFPLLKKKQAVYIYGNHDLKKHSDERIRDFAVQDSEHFTLKTNTHTLHIEHGHHYLSAGWQKPEAMIRFNRRVGFVKFYDTFSYHYYALHHFGQRRYLLVGLRWQNQLKKLARETLPANHYLVVGHTHIPEFSQEDHFINTGFINYRFASWLEISDTTFTLHRTHY